MAIQLVQSDSDQCRSEKSAFTLDANTAATKTTDHQLVERVKRGDRRAFDLLVIKYQSKVMAIVARYIRDQHEIKDVAQEAFIKAYRAIGSFRGESAFYTWLYRIAINAAKNYLLAKSRRPPGSDVEYDDAVYFEGSAGLKDINSPERQLQRDQLQTAIYSAIDALPEDLKSTLVLREFDGLSYEDIAEIMQCPVGTVRSRIFRARDTIDAHIAPLLESKERASV